MYIFYLFILFIVILAISRNKKLKSDINQSNSTNFSLNSFKNRFSSTPEYARPSFSEPKLSQANGLNFIQVWLLLIAIAAGFIILEATNTTQFVDAQSRQELKDWWESTGDTEFSSSTSSSFSSSTTTTTEGINLEPTIVKSTSQINIYSFTPPGVTFNLPVSGQIKSTLMDGYQQLDFYSNNTLLMGMVVWEEADFPYELPEATVEDRVTFGSHTWSTYRYVLSDSEPETADYSYILTKNGYTYLLTVHTPIQKGSNIDKILSSMKTQ